MLYLGAHHALGFAASYFIERCGNFKLCNWLARDMSSVHDLSGTLVEVISMLSHKELPKDVAVKLIRGIDIQNFIHVLTDADIDTAAERLCKDDIATNVVCTKVLRKRYQFYFARNVHYYLETDMHRSPSSREVEGFGSLHDLVMNNFQHISGAMYALYPCGCSSCTAIRYPRQN
jgi:hypothetical protein